MLFIPRLRVVCETSWHSHPRVQHSHPRVQLQHSNLSCRLVNKRKEGRGVPGRRITFLNLSANCVGWYQICHWSWLIVFRLQILLQQLHNGSRFPSALYLPPVSLHDIVPSTYSLLWWLYLGVYYAAFWLNLWILLCDSLLHVYFLSFPCSQTFREYIVWILLFRWFMVNFYEKIMLYLYHYFIKILCEYYEEVIKSSQRVWRLYLSASKTENNEDTPSLIMWFLDKWILSNNSFRVSINISV